MNDYCDVCGKLIRKSNDGDGGEKYIGIDIGAQYVEQYKIPFKCNKCGNIQFPYQAIRDIVFIWPDPKPPKTKGGLLIPEKFREHTGYGIVLSVGKGYRDKKGKFHPSLLKDGVRVLYNKDVPWQIPVELDNGRRLMVPFMGEQDILCLIDE